MRITGNYLEKVRSRLLNDTEKFDLERQRNLAYVESLLAGYFMSAVVRFPREPGGDLETGTLGELNSYVKFMRPYRGLRKLSNVELAYYQTLRMIAKRGMETPIDMPEVPDLETYR